MHAEILGDDVIIPQEGKEPGTPVHRDGLHYYPPGPVARAYLRDKSFVSGIRGPFRSGKSTASVMKLIKGAQLQARSQDGWKRRRTAIIRNTYPELRTTTMPTWFQWVPKHMGKWREAGPPMHHITDHVEKLDWEVWFIALDRPDDVSKLLSMELSDAWVNEAREVPKAVIDALTGRIGQYPARWQGGCTDPQLNMDTNSPDTDHWWYVLAEKDISNERNRRIIESTDEAQSILRSKGILTVNQNLFSFHAQPSGRAADAENLKNLRPGYYEFLMAGKDDEFVKVYVDGEYGFVMDGLPVFPEYKDSFHSREFPVLGSIGFRIGLDFGLTPAATIDQRLGNGRWLTQDEYVSERMGIVSFAHDLAKKLTERYPGVKLVSVRGDPSGDSVTPEESTCFKIMKANGFPLAEPAPTNDPVLRREAVANLLRIVVDGEPGIAIHKRCSVLRKGMAGGYNRRRLLVSGEIKYREVPDKNQYSHVCEALEYDCLSGGEARNVTIHPSVRERAIRENYAQSDYEILGA